MKWLESPPPFPIPDKSVLAMLDSLTQHQLEGVKIAIAEICESRNATAKILLGKTPGIAAEDSFSPWWSDAHKTEHGFGEGTTAYDRALKGRQEDYCTLLAEKNAAYQAALKRAVQ